ncbi:hypothetical protein N474_21925 [Pseudoalteromonas luteoviolacea CPMOR-2]|uniref:gamma-glutamylcyclotransferase family protein n=1 Tax=Pseudoalteromonas luteoviolacea TaxID=43657 RepID=UPI0007B061EE|nr:gamma-glutamylcyclotransferase family protein [Pseudoalteromonas luteoviolacea]KZN53185.1 hypothetical protein N474_21925 [Pseudoalteromonas luteoviolacea CPMOR-2]
MSKPVYYFAYGSNLSTKRLFSRLPQAQHVGVAELFGHVLTFAMLSKDGSAKCDIKPEASDFGKVLGVIYQLSETELSQLDCIEGERYDRVAKQVKLQSGQQITAYCYIANTFHSGEAPFSWYKQHVLYGAKEHNFPCNYINHIKNQTSTQDPDIRREKRELEIYK